MHYIQRICRSATVALCMLGLLFVTTSVHAKAMDEAWVSQLPTVEQIRAKVQGQNEDDTLAQQAATFDVLRMSFSTWANTLAVKRFPPRAQQLFQG